MILLRRVARPLLASVFIVGGLDSLASPAAKAVRAKPVLDLITTKVPQLPQSTEQLVQLNAGVQVLAGTTLALGRFPRLSAFALAASLVPTTAAGHRFWEEQEPAARAAQRIHFFKNLSALGGLLLAGADTEGRPSLGWRAQHRAHHVAGSSRHALRAGRREAKLAAREARLTAQSRWWRTRARMAS